MNLIGLVLELKKSLSYQWQEPGLAGTDQEPGPPESEPHPQCHTWHRSSLTNHQWPHFTPLKPSATRRTEYILYGFPRRRGRPPPRPSIPRPRATGPDSANVTKSTSVGSGTVSSGYTVISSGLVSLRESVSESSLSFWSEGNLGAVPSGVNENQKEGESVSISSQYMIFVTRASFLLLLILLGSIKYFFARFSICFYFYLVI